MVADKKSEDSLHYLCYYRIKAKAGRLSHINKINSMFVKPRIRIGTYYHLNLFRNEKNENVLLMFSFGVR